MAASRRKAITVGPCPFVESALVLAEGDILRAMHVVLNVPATMHLKGKDCQLVQSSQS